MSLKICSGLFAFLLVPMAVLAREDAIIRDSIPHPVTRKRVSPLGRKSVQTKVQFGIASYYANKFEGRKTYTDEIFSQKKFTAASNTLPMRTWVRVTNLRNKRSVVLRINDKMHPKNKRLIDLSQAAAARLGYKGRGLTHVRIDVLGRKRPVDAE